MEELKYHIGVDKIDWEQLTDLYEEIGLIRGLGKKREIDKIKAAFLNSFKVVTVWEGDRLVGAGRMVSDGICYGMIFDLGVLPKYQKKGIGNGLITRLIEGNDHLCLHLTSTFGNENFYKNVGFNPHKTAMAKYPYKSDYLDYE